MGVAFGEGSIGIEERGGVGAGRRGINSIIAARTPKVVRALGGQSRRDAEFRVGVGAALPEHYGPCLSDVT